MLTIYGFNSTFIGLGSSMKTQEDIQLEANISEGKLISVDELAQNDVVTQHHDVERDSWKIFRDKSNIPSDHIESPKLVTFHNPHIKMHASISSEIQQLQSDKTHYPVLEKKHEYSFKGSLESQEEMAHNLLVSEHSSLLQIPSNFPQTHYSEVQQNEQLDVTEIQCEMNQHDPIKLQVNLGKQRQQIVSQDVNIINYNGDIQRTKSLSQCTVAFSNRTEESEDSILSTACNTIQQVLVEHNHCHQIDGFQVTISKKEELLQQNNEHIEMDIDAFAHNEIQDGMGSQSSTFSSLDGAKHSNTCSQQIDSEHSNDTLLLHSGLLSHDIEYLKKQDKCDTSSKCGHSSQHIPQGSTTQSKKVEEPHPFQVVNQFLENSFQNSLISHHFQDPLIEKPEQQQLEIMDEMPCRPMSLTKLEILPQVTKSSQQQSDAFPCHFNNYQPCDNHPHEQVNSSSHSEINVLTKHPSNPALVKNDREVFKQQINDHKQLHDPCITKECFEEVSPFRESTKQSSVIKLSHQPQDQLNILQQNVMQEADVNTPHSGIEQEHVIIYQKTLSMQSVLKTPQPKDEHVPEIQENPQTVGIPLFHFNSSGTANPLLSSGSPFPKSLMLKVTILAYLIRIYLQIQVLSDRMFGYKNSHGH